MSRSLAQASSSGPGPVFRAWDVDLSGVTGPSDLRHVDVFGLDPLHEDWCLRGAREHVVPADREAFDEAVYRALETGVLLLEARVRWPDGSTRWLASRGRFDSAGASGAARGAGVALDVTEQRRGEELLAVQAELLELVTQDRPLEECLDGLCAKVRRLHPGMTASVQVVGSHEDGHAPGPNCLLEPIVGSSGRQIGSLHLCFEEGRPAADWQARLAATTAWLAGIAIEREQARRAARAESHRQAFLLELSDALRALDDEAAISTLATRLLGERLGAGMCFFGAFDEAEDLFTISPGYATGGSVVPAGSVRRSAFSDLLAPLEAGPYVVRDIAERHGLSEERKQELLGAGIHSFVTIPLHRGARNPIWCLAVTAPAPRDWEVDEVNLVSEVAERTWGALERANATAALRASQNELRMELADARRLQEISLRLIEQDDIQALYESLLDAAVSVMGARFGSFQVLDSERQQLKLLASHDLPPAALRHFRVVEAGSGSPCGLALVAGSRVIVPDVEASEEMRGTRDQKVLLQAGIRSAHSTPLVSRAGYVVGMINTHWEEPHEPSERQLRLLDVIARQAADLIERRRGEDQLALLNKRLERANRSLEALNHDLEHQVQERTQELARSQVRFSQAFEVSPVAACITTEDGAKVLEVNRAFTVLTGFGPDEVVGRRGEQVGLWSSRADRALLESALAGGERFEDIELRLRAKDGTHRDVLASGDRIRVNDSFGWLQLFLDVSERKRSQEELMRAIKEVMADTTWFSRRLVERLAHVQGRDDAGSGADVLSERERQVLARISRGMANDEIAVELDITPRTVRNHLANIYAKIDVHSRAEAVVWARERGITT